MKDNPASQKHNQVKDYSVLDTAVQEKIHIRYLDDPDLSFVHHLDNAEWQSFFSNETNDTTPIRKTKELIVSNDTPAKRREMSIDKSDLDAVIEVNQRDLSEANRIGE